jgi:glutathione S-transferase
MAPADQPGEAAFTLVIANKNYSSWSLRGWLALKHVGVPFQEVVVPLRQPDTRATILRYSPSGKAPCLIHRTNGETVTVWESLAIGEYLAEQFPTAGLWPADAAARAHARSIAHEMHGGFVPLRRAMPMNIRLSLPGYGMADGVQEDINRIEAIWRETRNRFGAGGALLFGSFTMADAMFAPVALRFRSYGVPLGDDATAYMNALLAMPAMKDWMAAAESEPWMIPDFEKDGVNGPAAPKQ